CDPHLQRLWHALAHLGRLWGGVRRVPQAEARRQAVHGDRRRHPEPRLSLRHRRGGGIPGRGGDAVVRQYLEPRRRQSAIGQPAGRTPWRRRGPYPQAPGRARLHVRGHRQDPSRPRLGAEGKLRGGRRARARGHRVLARRAAVDARLDRAGDHRLVQDHGITAGIDMMDDASKSLVSHKIRSAQEIAAAVGARPREKKVIMCHGTFDIVHPGHVRHLLYAKSKGDVLVASLTADAHIAKANFRPFVPQELRAFNLAALEVVDFVVIDNDPTPIKNISIIKPDYFAKGYEYTRDGLHPRTAEEKAAVEAYGGEIIFTPGDIVYSSSNIIETEPPAIATEKLMALLEAEGLEFDGLRDALDKLNGVRVHVVGDTIIDSYTHTVMIGGMTKTPTMSVRFDNRVDFVG